MPKPLPPVPPHHHPDNIKPLSPLLESLPYNQKVQENKLKSLTIALIFGSFITLILGLVLKFFSISINIILPVLAPVWVGSITLIYSVNSKS